MANVFVVASYIKDRVPSAEHDKLKLHKLLYFAQAWNLAWDGKELFDDRLEAWAGGPVSPHVYGADRYSQPFPIGSLPPDEERTLDAVIGAYGEKSGQWLSILTHRERPWREARGNLAPTEKSKNIISVDVMRDTYRSHKAGGYKAFSPEYLRGLDLLVSLPEDEVEILQRREFTDDDGFLELLETGEDPSEANGAPDPV